jgi:hypothetical protein
MSAQPTEQPCIRRNGSIWTRCRCPRCTPDQQRARKAYEAGHIPTGTAANTHRDHAWHIIARMIDDGWTNNAIADACDISIRTANELRHAHHSGDRRNISHSLYRRIINHRQPSGDSYLPATGTIRRLQALARLGWSGDHLHTHTGIPRMTLSDLTNGKWQRIRIHLADTIDAAYREHEHTPGPSTQARTRAGKKGWAPPAAWDDIDDPNERPKGLGGPKHSATEHVLTEVNHLADQGLDFETIAEALDRQPAALERFLQRHQQHQLLARLKPRTT